MAMQTNARGILQRLVAGLVLVTGLLACDDVGRTSTNMADNDTLTVVLIRHAEKPSKGDNLSCQGHNRAMQWASVLAAKQLIPNAIYVPALGMGNTTSHSRMLQTATPLAVKWNLAINTDYDAKDESRAAKHALKQRGTVLMVWSHREIPKLAKALGLKQVPAWPDDDFDSLWVITFHNGEAVLRKEPAGMTPPAICAY